MNRLKTLTFAATTALAVATFSLLPGAQEQTAKQMQEPQGGLRLRPDARRTGSGRGCSMPGLPVPRPVLNLTEEQDALFGPVEDAYRAHGREFAGSACQDRPGNKDAAP